MPYTLVFVLLTILSLYEFLDVKPDGVLVKKSYKTYFYALCTCSLWLIAALRFETGRDWEGYMQFFENCLRPRYISGFEPGFVRLNRLFKSMGLGFYGLQFFISSFCAFMVFRNIQRTSECPSFTLLLYVLMFYFATDMAQTRQHIAMAILILGGRAVRERKLLLWILIVALAMMFHVTAITAFPLYFTGRIQIGRRFVWVLFAVYIILYLFGLPFVRGGLEMVLRLPFVPARIGVIGNAYLNSKIYGQQVKFNSGLGFLANTFFNGLIVYFSTRKENSGRRIWLVNYFIGLYFMAFGRNFDQFARIANYYYICGNGLCAYNLLIKSKGFFRKVDFLRYFMCFMFFALQFYSFVGKWYLYDKLTHTSYHLDYTPYRAFIFE